MQMAKQPAEESGYSNNNSDLKNQRQQVEQVIIKLGSFTEGFRKDNPVGYIVGYSVGQ